jgi:hypothetical protein
MNAQTNRRQTMVGLGAAFAMLAAKGGAAAAASTPPSLIPRDAAALNALTSQLAAAPRRRAFKTVPMILTRDDQWDSEAFKALLAYRSGPRQVWHNRKLDGPWLELMDNAVTAEVFSFHHADFLAVSATHNSTGLALFDQAAWDKYKLASIAPGKIARNSFILDKGNGGDPADIQNPAGVYGGDAVSIPYLMRRGAVFLMCHHAIWEGAKGLHAGGANPDKLSVEELAADLTNHILPQAIVVPGLVAAIGELETAGYNYIDS